MLCLLIKVKLPSASALKGNGSFTQRKKETTPPATELMALGYDDFSDLIDLINEPSPAIMQKPPQETQCRYSIIDTALQSQIV
jgi:hypothetical protein